MKREDMHIIGRQLVRLLSGQLSPDEERAAKEHILQCGECRREYDMLSIAVSSRESAAEPSARVRDGILSAWDNAARRRAPRRFSAVFKAAALVSAAAAFCGVLFTAYLLLSPSPERRSSVFAFSGISGDVFADGVQAREKEFLPFRSRIVTGDTGRAVIAHDGFSIRILPSSVLVVHSEEDGARLSGIIEKGTIVSSSAGFTSYSYAAAGYTITPKGTVFSVSVNSSIVSVCVSSGRVSVSDDAGNERAVLEANSKWTSSNAPSVSAMSADDFALFGVEVRDDTAQKSEKPAVGAEQHSESAGAAPDKTAEESRQKEREELRKERSDIQKDRSDIKAEQKELKKMKRKGRENP